MSLNSYNYLVYKKSCIPFILHMCVYIYMCYNTHNYRILFICHKLLKTFYPFNNSNNPEKYILSTILLMSKLRLRDVK